MLSITSTYKLIFKRSLIQCEILNTFISKIEHMERDPEWCNSDDMIEGDQMNLLINSNVILEFRLSLTQPCKTKL